MKAEILKKAIELGFADAKFVSAEPVFLKNGACIRPQDYLKGAASILVLFWAYRVASAAKQLSQIGLSRYYPASHQSYHRSRDLAKWLSERGIEARVADALPARELALRSGGFLGKNTFYFHPELGSQVILHTIVTNLKLEFEPAAPLGHSLLCENCDKCVSACPMNAIPDGIQISCLRQLMDKNPVKPQGRGSIYQLLGCERCQMVCPYNTGRMGEPIVFEIEDILTRGAIPKIKQMCGANMARTNILLSQTLVYVGKNGLKDYIPLVLELLKEPLLEESAKWALDRLSEH